MSMPTEPTRAYIYRCLLSLQPIIIAYGLTTSEKAALWSAFASAVLGLGLATANTSTGR